MGRMSRDKGKRGEREAAALFRQYGFDARRGVQYHGGPDSPDVTGVPGLHIEVKRVERLALYDALDQARRDAGPEEIPVVVHRKNDCRWVVVLGFEDFMTLYREWHSGRTGHEG